MSSTLPTQSSSIPALLAFTAEFETQNNLSNAIHNNSLSSIDNILAQLTQLQNNINNHNNNINPAQAVKEIQKQSVDTKNKLNTEYKDLYSNLTNLNSKLDKLTNFDLNVYGESGPALNYAALNELIVDSLCREGLLDVAQHFKAESKQLKKPNQHSLNNSISNNNNNNNNNNNSVTNINHTNGSNKTSNQQNGDSKDLNNMVDDNLITSSTEFLSRTADFLSLKAIRNSLQAGEFQQAIEWTENKLSAQKKQISQLDSITNELIQQQLAQEEAENDKSKHKKFKTSKSSPSESKSNVATESVAMEEDSLSSSVNPLSPSVSIQPISSSAAQLTAEESDDSEEESEEESQQIHLHLDDHAASAIASSSLQEAPPHSTASSLLQSIQSNQAAIINAKSYEMELKGLLFDLHRVKFLQILYKSAETGHSIAGNNLGSNYTAALSYAQRYFTDFAVTKMEEIRKLSGLLMFSTISPQTTPNSQQNDLNYDKLLLSAEELFVKLYCYSEKIAVEDPLLISLLASDLALPQLEKYLAFVRGGKAVAREGVIPSTALQPSLCELQLNDSLQYHSAFVCPVTRELCGPENPPVMLVCGHLISTSAVDKMVRNLRLARRFKCFPPDHQVLTIEGFKFIGSINKEDLVATFNPSAQALEYHHIIAEPVEYDVINEPMVDIKQESNDFSWRNDADEYGRNSQLGPDVPSNHIAIMTTEDHDWFVKYGQQTTNFPQIQWDAGEFRKVEGHQLNAAHSPAQATHFKILTQPENGIALPNTYQSNSTDLPFAGALGLTEAQQIDAFLQLYGCWLRDGTMQNNRTSIVICPSKGCNSEYLEKLFSICGLHEENDWHSSNNQNGMNTYSICSESWVRYFASVYGVNEAGVDPTINDKRFPSWVFQRLTRDEVRSLLRGLLETDRRNRCVYTSSARFRDEIIQAGLHAGYSGYYAINTDKNPSDWKVSFSDQMGATAVFDCSTEVHSTVYSGKVHCISVPNGLIFARRVKCNSDNEITLASRAVIIGQCPTCPKEQTQAEVKTVYL
jgi:hypothetical protein